MTRVTGQEFVDLGGRDRIDTEKRVIFWDSRQVRQRHGSLELWVRKYLLSPDDEILRSVQTSTLVYVPTNFNLDFNWT